VTSFLAGLVARGAGVLPQPAAELRRAPQFPLATLLGRSGDEPHAARRPVGALESEPESHVADRRATVAAETARLAPRVTSSADAARTRRPAPAPRTDTPALRARPVVRDVTRSMSATSSPGESVPSAAPPPPASAPRGGSVQPIATPASVRSPPAAALPRAEARGKEGRPRAHESPPRRSGDAAEHAPMPALEPRLLVPRPDMRAAPRTFPRVETRPRPAPPQIEVRIGRIDVRRPEPHRPEPPPAEQPPAEVSFARLAAARHYVDRLWS
jgi:hypothetical protein